MENINTQTMSGLPVLLFLDVSGGELLVIMLVVFLVFGPEKMPEMARKAGRLMNQMKKATNDLTNEFKKETSVLQDEISKVHRDVNDQFDSVSREVNRTKAQIVSEMNTEKKTTNAADPSVQATESTDIKPLATEEPHTENNTQTKE